MFKLCENKFKIQKYNILMFNYKFDNNWIILLNKT